MALRTRPPVANAGKARAGEAGSALLAVLGAVAALSAIAFAMMAAAHNALDRASLQADSAKAYFLARGGIEAALHEMSAGIVPGHMAAGMDSREYVFETGVAKVSIASENGKLNVNRTGREAMASLLASAGATQVESDSLAERILSYPPRFAGWSAGSLRSAPGTRFGTFRAFVFRASHRVYTSD